MVSESAVVAVCYTVSCIIQSQKKDQADYADRGESCGISCFFVFGFDEAWWKSTMCFPAGYFCAMYKKEIMWRVNKSHKLILIVSIITMPLFFVMACLVDSYIVKVTGNTLLMLSMIIVLESIRFDARVAGIIGTASLEVYLSHISLCSWFLQDKAPDTAGIVFVVIGSTIAAVSAKIIDDRILPKIRSI